MTANLKERNAFPMKKVQMSKWHIRISNNEAEVAHFNSFVSTYSTPSCHLNLGLPRLLCPCERPKKTLRAGSFVSMRTTWPAHRSLASLKRCTTVRSPCISYSSSLYRLLHCPSTHTGQVSFWASSSRTRLRGFRQIWTVSMSQRRMWVPELYRYYIVPASSVATGSLRWTDFSGCRMTGWQPIPYKIIKKPQWSKRSREDSLTGFPTIYWSVPILSRLHTIS